VRKSHKKRRSLRGTTVLDKPMVKMIKTALAGNSY
jgi:ribosomal protein L35